MTLFVHIGRNKAGSSTVQGFLLENSALIAELGCEYLDIGRVGASHLGLANELRARGRGRPTAQRFRDALARGGHSHFLISSEYFFDFRHDLIRDLVMLANPHEVKVIAYIRQYPEWIRSQYAQSTKKRKNADDFDTFFAARTDILTAFPALQQWADVLGWKNVRVRSLDAASLDGGKLTADILHAVGLEARQGSFTESTTRNVAPPWVLLEFRRALTGLRSRSIPLERAISGEKRLYSHFARCVKRRAWPQSQVQYLTPEQYATAALCFNEDVAKLNALSGSSIPSMETTLVPARPFLPSFEMIPPALLSAFFRRAWTRLIRASLVATRDSPYRSEMYRLLMGLRARNRGKAAI